MFEWYAAGTLWRLENRDAQTRRQSDERLGQVAYVLRRAVGSLTRRPRTGRRVECDPRPAPVTG
jgi:hypothetical protein